MGAVPAHPWFPASAGGGGGGGPRFSTAHLITVASALRLGSLLRCSDHLHRLLLCSSSPESCHFDDLHRIKDVWWRRPWSPRRYPLGEELADNIRASCSSCTSFFNGEDSKNYLGPIVEQLTGPRRFLAVYFTSAVASSVMSYRFCQLPAVGASGAIFGLMGSFAVFILRHRSLYGRGMEDIQHVARVIALNMIIGFLSKGIDNWGHLGGLLGGAALSWFLGPLWKYNSQTRDGRAVFVDAAPIIKLTRRRRID